MIKRRPVAPPPVLELAAKLAGQSLYAGPSGRGHPPVPHAEESPGSTG